MQQIFPVLSYIIPLLIETVGIVLFFITLVGLKNKTSFKQLLFYIIVDIITVLITNKFVSAGFNTIILFFIFISIFIFFTKIDIINAFFSASIVFLSMVLQEVLFFTVLNYVFKIKIDVALGDPFYHLLTGTILKTLFTAIALIIYKYDIQLKKKMYFNLPKTMKLLLMC